MTASKTRLGEYVNSRCLNSLCLSLDYHSTAEILLNILSGTHTIRLLLIERVYQGDKMSCRESDRYQSSRQTGMQVRHWLLAKTLSHRSRGADGVIAPLLVNFG